MKYLLLLVPLALFVLVIPAFAQSLDNRTNYDIQVNATTGEPVLEQISDKGIYRVLFKWPTQVSNSEGGIEVEIVFLNASAPVSTAQNNTQTETITNAPGTNTSETTGSNDTSIEPTLPVKSYDMAIFGGDGKELWKKLEQPGLGGRGTQSLQFKDNYTGPITIEINNIKPGWDIGENTTESDLTDSVKFMATVVPEFPIVVMSLAAGVAAAIALVRLRSRQFT